MVKITMSTVTFILSAHNQARFLSGCMQSRNRARIELQEIGFDAVTEDHTGGRHEGFQYELLFLLKHAGNDTGLRVTAYERLAHDVQEVSVFPWQPDGAAQSAATKSGNASGHIKDRRHPAAGSGAG